MALQSIDPATGTRHSSLPAWDAVQIDMALEAVSRATPTWQATSLADRGRLLHATAAVLRRNSETYARLITQEMGKAIREARAEIEKCAWGCEYYAEHAPRFLADEEVRTDANRSLIAYQPLGTVLAIMPWNFPFWQVFRFAAPALMAGNTAVLKHAANTTRCALAIEDCLRQAGLPADVFRTLPIESRQVAGVIADRRVHAVTLTGSEKAGREVAQHAGAHLKKSVLELGGSDAFVVLADADLASASAAGAAARCQNAGQSCIAAKRFVVVQAVADEFVMRLAQAMNGLKVGDHNDEATALGPLARADLRDALQQQVNDSIAQGADAHLGCAPLPGPGNFYPPSILDHVQPGMRAYEEELFGPVAIVIRARDEDDALRIANDHRYGLGGSVWTRDTARGEAFARRMQCGSAFVNAIVKSDPRLPFGGIKASGYGRELGVHGIREFVNTKTLWIA